MVKRTVWAVVATIGLLGCQQQKKPDRNEQVSIAGKLRNLPPVVQEAGLPTEKLAPDDVLSFLNAEKRSSEVDLWQRLGIDDWSWGYRKAEKFEFDLDKAGKLAVIQLAEPGNIPDVRYLFFRNKDNQGWRFVSYFDDVEQQYGPLGHKVEFAGDQVWFVVKSLGAHGSGLSWHYFKWLSLKNKEAKPVLYLNDCCESYIGEPVICERWSVKQKGLIMGKYIVKARGRFTWSDIGDGEEIFSKEGERVYVWNSQRDKFNFDRKASTLSESAWNKYSLKWDAGFSHSLNLYCTDLLKVASKGKPNQKTWLKWYLETVTKKSACRRQLLSVVNDG